MKVATKNPDLLSGGKDFGMEFLTRSKSKKDSFSVLPGEHYHDHYEIFYLYSGERYYFIQNQSYYIKKGDLVIIDALDLHKTLDGDTEQYQRFLINFKKSFLPEHGEELLNCFSSGTNVMRLNESEQAFVEELLLKMFSEHNSRRFGREIYLKSLLSELLVFINRLPFEIYPKELFSYSPMHLKISEAAKYIQSHCGEILTLEDVAKKFYISPYYFCRKFKEVTGFNFSQYLNLTRIRQAQKLLLQTDLSVSEISGKTGFESQTHFGRIFKATTGLSPLQYKKKHLNPEFNAENI
ncbi:MAG TPA: AraC family transcriptional regulator [Oscillospiraceae bacterium]|nr:AraC family transcriptional regulator [Oscillospiraceae bacterium]